MKHHCRLVGWTFLGGGVVMSVIDDIIDHPGYFAFTAAALLIGHHSKGKP